MEEASETSGQTPWLHVTVTEAIEARLSSLSAPNPLGWDWLTSRPEMRLPAGAVLLKMV